MSVLPSDIIVYGSVNMPEADSAITGGAVDFPVVSRSMTSPRLATLTLFPVRQATRRPKSPILGVIRLVLFRAKL